MSNTPWQQKRVSELIDGLAAGVSVRSAPAVEFGPAILKTSSVDRGRFVPSEAKTILAADLPRARCSPVGDSMILSRMNTPAMVGDVGYVAEEWPELFLPDRLWMARARRRSGTSMRWLTYHFASEPGARELRALATGTSGSMKNIPKDRILDLRISTPPPAEQRAIASALADGDALIEALEDLVDKKRDIRNGVARELLSGRVRLPSFTGDWKPISLGAMGSTYGGLVGKSGEDFGHGASRFVTFVEVMRDVRLLGSELASVAVGIGERQNPVQRGDVLFNGSSETPEEVALAAAVQFDLPGVYLNSFCFGFRLFRGDVIDPLFLAYLFRAAPGRALCVSLAQGSTRYNIAKTKLMAAEIVVPEFKEQQAIASILRDADDEIVALERRLESARAVKTGMMQELLTGRTRLSVEVAS